jgi:RNA polymerase sigma-70 factor (ECF subfamily)
VLGWSGAETAELLDSSVSAVHSALQRARATVDLQLPARSAFPRRAAESELLRRYVDAWERTDIRGLVALMREDAVLLMPPQPAIVGGEAIAAFFARVRSTSHLTARAVWAGGSPAVAISKRGDDGELRPYRLLVLEADGERVARLGAYSDPRVLAAFAS